MTTHGTSWFHYSRVERRIVVTLVGLVALGAPPGAMAQAQAPADTSKSTSQVKGGGTADTAKKKLTGSDSLVGKASDTLVPSLDSVEVIKLRRLNRKVSVEEAGPTFEDEEPLPSDSVVTAGMDDIIVLVVRHLDDLVRRSKCLTASDKRVTSCTTQPILLYLDGRAIVGLEPESGAPISGASVGTLRFHLERTEKSDEAWADLLGAPPLGKKQFFLRPAEVSAGLANGYPVKADRIKKNFAIQRIHEGWFWPTVAGYLLMFGFFVLYTRKSDIVRDMGLDPDPITDPRTGATIRRLKPYSLARVQMAWWFFWVVGGFFFIFFINRSYEIITGTALALIGISAGTLVGSVAIDSEALAQRRRSIAAARLLRQKLMVEVDNLEAEGKNPPPGATMAELQALYAKRKGELAAVRQELEDANARGEIPASAGFFRDLLADPEGQSFHRFQMIVWTLALTVLFVVSVYRRLAMPEFNATLLGLLGITNGVYLGFKIPERRQAESIPTK